MGSAEDYRRHAADCLELAMTMDDPQVRAALMHMTQVWLRLADQKNDGGNMSKAAE
jgi:hypothetical protein